MNEDIPDNSIKDFVLENYSVLCREKICLDMTGDFSKRTKLYHLASLCCPEDFAGEGLARAYGLLIQFSLAYGAGLGDIGAARIRSVMDEGLNQVIQTTSTAKPGALH